MTKELMQQALDALNESIDCVRTEYAVFVENYGMNPSQKVWLDVMKSGIDKHEAAISALELAIAQPVQPTMSDAEIIKAAYAGPIHTEPGGFVKQTSASYRKNLEGEFLKGARWAFKEKQPVQPADQDCGIKDGESIGQAAEGWAQWCEARGNQMLANFLREATAQPVQPAPVAQAKDATP